MFQKGTGGFQPGLNEVLLRGFAGALLKLMAEIIVAVSAGGRKVLKFDFAGVILFDIVDGIIQTVGGVGFFVPASFQGNDQLLDFMYLLRSVIKRFRSYAKAGTEIIAHSVLEEIVLYLIAEESEFLMEEEGLWECDEEQIYSSATEWIFDLFEGEDIITFLYDDFYLEKDNMFHFDHWKDRVFWVER